MDEPDEPADIFSGQDVKQEQQTPGDQNKTTAGNRGKRNKGCNKYGNTGDQNTETQAFPGNGKLRDLEQSSETQ